MFCTLMMRLIYEVNALSNSSCSWLRPILAANKFQPRTTAIENGTKKNKMGLNLPRTCGRPQIYYWSSSHLKHFFPCPHLQHPISHRIPQVAFTAGFIPNLRLPRPSPRSASEHSHIAGHGHGFHGENFRFNRGSLEDVVLIFRPKSYLQKCTFR